MSIRTKFNPMGSDTKCTLTVTTNPQSAVCTLTYRGQTYTSKSVTVPKGTEVSYSISYSNTTSKTGSVIMNNNKTLIFTRVSTTSNISESWTQPILSDYGTLGSSTFAVADDGHYGSATFWRCFDGKLSGNYDGYFRTGYGPYRNCKVTIYNPTPIKITSIKSYNMLVSAAMNFGTGTIWTSDNNSDYTQISSYSNLKATGSTKNDYVIIPVNSNDYYKYYQIRNTGTPSNISGTIVGSAEFVISATYKKTSTTYYFELTQT